jgi:hypothetical protein
MTNNLKLINNHHFLLFKKILLIKLLAKSKLKKMKMILRFRTLVKPFPVSQLVTREQTMQQMPILALEIETVILKK